MLTIIFLQKKAKQQQQQQYIYMEMAGGRMLEINHFQSFEDLQLCNIVE